LLNAGVRGSGATTEKGAACDVENAGAVRRTQA
jgi:hypothetical protein